MKFVFSLYRLKLTQVQRTPTEFGPPVLTHIRKMSCNFWLSNTFSLKRLTIGVRAGGARGAAAPPKFGQLRFFWAAKENLGKASF